MRGALAASQPIGTALADHVEDAMESMTETDDAVVSQLEQLWEVRPAGAAGAAARRRDALRGALAVGAHYLSADGSSFAHGQVTGGLEFWHPDTVLMALFRTEAGLYVDVRLDLVDLQNGATLRVIRDKAPRSSGTCTRAISVRREPHRQLAPWLSSIGVAACLRA